LSPRYPGEVLVRAADLPTGGPKLLRDAVKTLANAEGAQRVAHVQLQRARDDLRHEQTSFPKKVAEARRDGKREPVSREEELGAAVEAAERDVESAGALHELRLREIRALTEANRAAWTAEADAAIETARVEAAHACDVLEAKLAALQSAAAYRRWLAQSTRSRSARCSRPKTLSLPVDPIRQSIQAFGAPPAPPPEPPKTPVRGRSGLLAVKPTKHGYQVESMRSRLP
jgi:hypothetical protein